MPEVRLIDANAAMVYKKQELFKAVRKVINHCPTIDPETLRPVAHWENGPDGIDSDIFSCSNCCERICLEDQGYFPEMDYKFCPYCGARMEGVE